MYAPVISQRLFSFRLKNTPVHIESSRSLYSGLKLLELLNQWRRPSFPDTYKKIFIYFYLCVFIYLLTIPLIFTDVELVIYMLAY